MIYQEFTFLYNKNTQKNYTEKIFMTQIITVVWSLTHLEPDILECEVKSALGSITMNKASGGYAS